MDNPWKIKAGGIYKSLMKRKENDLNQTSMIMFDLNLQGCTLPATNSLPLKINWKMKCSFWDGLLSGNMFVLGSVVRDGISTLQKKREALTIVQTQTKHGENCTKLK